ncbi:MAG: glycerophosphodiester phosphodiesterase [Pyrinomonadaceae bacterium]
MSKLPLIIAHRGASTDAPENTLAAFRYAVKAGADGVEFDVRLARDGVPVVIHDATLKRTGALNRKVADLTSAQLGTIDAGSWFNNQFPRKAMAEFADEKVPTLKQAIDQLSGFDGVIYIEMKCGDGDYDQLARAVCDVIRDSPRLSQMIVKSFKLAAIPVIHRHLPDVKTAALVSPKVLNLLRNRKQILAIANEFGADQISLHRSLVTGRLIEMATEAGLAIAVWTADNPKWVKRCQKLGIEMLITNDPALMLGVRNV